MTQEMRENQYHQEQEYQDPQDHQDHQDHQDQGVIYQFIQQLDNVCTTSYASYQLLTYYHTIQTFGVRKFWRNSSHQKLVDNILVNAQICKSTKNNNYVSTFTSQMESQSTTMVCGCNETFYQKSQLGILARTLGNWLVTF